MSYRHKNGPGKTYPPEQLAIFAKYRDQRASVRPLLCQGGEGCWVELGPPGLTTHAGGATNQGCCAKCGGPPKLLCIAPIRAYQR
jgi:hypothetical protein